MLLLTASVQLTSGTLSQLFEDREARVTSFFQLDETRDRRKEFQIVFANFKNLIGIPPVIEFLKWSVLFFKSSLHMFQIIGNCQTIRGRDSFILHLIRKFQSHFWRHTSGLYVFLIRTQNVFRQPITLILIEAFFPTQTVIEQLIKIIRELRIFALYNFSH